MKPCNAASRTGRRLLHAVLTPVLLAGLGVPAAAEDVAGGFRPRPLSRIPAGTVVLGEPADDAARVLLFVRGRLAAGDTDAVTDTMRYYTALFNLVYTADVRRTDAGGHRLADVAVGFATTIGGRHTVITAESAARLGAGLSLVGSTVLADNEAALRDITLTALDHVSAVVDAPSVVRFEGRNHRMTVRFFIWVAEADGRLGTAAWLLRDSPTAREFAENSFQFLAAGTVEDRVMHVDKSKFLLGLPTAEAFAMAVIPQGRGFAVTPRLRAAGSRPSFDRESLTELAASLSEAMSDAIQP